MRTETKIPCPLIGSVRVEVVGKKRSYPLDRVEPPCSVWTPLSVSTPAVLSASV